MATHKLRGSLFLASGYITYASAILDANLMMNAQAEIENATVWKDQLTGPDNLTRLAAKSARNGRENWCSRY